MWNLASVLVVPSPRPRSLTLSTMVLTMSPPHAHGISWVSTFPKRIGKRVAGRPACHSTRQADEGGDEDMAEEDEAIEVTFPRITTPSGHLEAMTLG